MRYRKGPTDAPGGVVRYRKRPTDTPGRIVRYRKRPTDAPGGGVRYRRRPTDTSGRVMRYRKGPTDATGRVVRYRQGSFQFQVFRFKWQGQRAGGGQLELKTEHGKLETRKRRGEGGRGQGVVHRRRPRWSSASRSKRHRGSVLELSHIQKRFAAPTDRQADGGELRGIL